MPLLVLYLAVNVFDPVVRPLTENVLVTPVAVVPVTVIDRVSEAATPVAVNDMKTSTPPALPERVPPTVTIAMPEAGMVTVTDGPAPPARSV